MALGEKEKLIARLMTEPADFTFDEVETLLGYLGYERDNKGKTSGSRVKFFRPGTSQVVYLHRPHPGNILPRYQVKNIVRSLKEADLI